MQIDHEVSQRHLSLRVTVVIVILALAIAYTVAVVAGAIPKARQLDGTHLTLLFFALLISGVILRPQILNRLARLEGLGFKVELLERLQERQVAQAEELYRLDLIVPLLFRDSERKHLASLFRGSTDGYRGGGIVRDELRRLRAIGLLRSLPQRAIAIFTAILCLIFPIGSN